MIWRRARLLAAIVLAAQGLPACSRACTEEASVGIEVVVRDALTGARLCDAAIVAIDGSYRESLYYVGLCTFAYPYGGAVERAGNYRLEVSQAGYISKSIDGVSVVQQNDCHVRTQQLTVDLDADPSAPVDAGKD
jgi:hypothetical protein